MPCSSEAQTIILYPKRAYTWAYMDHELIKQTYCQSKSFPINCTVFVLPILSRPVVYTKRLHAFAHLFEREPRRVAQIAALALEQRMRLVADQEHNVGRDFAMRLVALFLERDLRAGLPARLDGDTNVFVLFFRRAVRLDDSSRDFHFFHTASVDLLECGVQIVLYGRVLLFFFFQRRMHVERVWSASRLEIWGNE